MKNPGFMGLNGLGLSTAFSVMALWASDAGMPLLSEPRKVFFPLGFRDQVRGPA